MMIFSAHQPQYLPWLGYFDKIAKSDCFVFLDRVQYKHREYQNRNMIRARDRSIWLTVPVLSKGLRHQLISEVRIDRSVDWQGRHWKSLKAWYARAPHFKEYAPFFEDTFTGRRWDTLMDINVYLIRYFLEQFEITTPLYFESELGTGQTGTERILEIAKKLNVQAYLSGAGGKDYLEEQRFIQEGVELRYQNFVHPAYEQQCAPGKNDFIPNMSALDLLFNEGRRSKDILVREVKK